MRPMMASAPISADIAAVFEMVADLEQHPRFSTDEILVQHSAGSGTGATYESRAKSAGHTFSAQLTVITSVPPKQFSFRAEDETGTYMHRFDLIATDDGCLVTRTVTAIRLTATQRALYMLALYPVKRPSLSKSLERLSALF